MHILCSAVQSDQFHLSSSTSHRERSGLGERILIGERHAILSVEIVVRTRCARTSPEICHDGFSEWRALCRHHHSRTTIIRVRFVEYLTLTLSFLVTLLFPGLPEC